jgi:hypothetical protein
MEEAVSENAILQGVQKDTKIFTLLKFLLANPQGVSRASITETLKMDDKCISNLLHYLTHIKKMNIEKCANGDLKLLGKNETPPAKRKYHHKKKTSKNSNIDRFKQLLEDNYQGISVKSCCTKLRLKVGAIYNLANRLRSKGFIIEFKNNLYIIQPYSDTKLVPKQNPSGPSMTAKLGKDLDKLPDPQHIINKLSDIPMAEQKDALHHLKHGIFNFRVVQAILDSNKFVKDLENELKKGWM